MYFIFIIIVKEIFNKIGVPFRKANPRPPKSPQLPSHADPAEEGMHMPLLFPYLLSPRGVCTGLAKSPNLGASLTTGHWVPRGTCDG